jgi:hypothetical protein
MTDRNNTLVYTFDPKSPRINAYQIHEWLHATAHLREEDVSVIQIDGPLRKVYVKFVTKDIMMRVFKATPSDMEFCHEDGVISTVMADIAGIGIRRIGISSLPPEVTETQIKSAIAMYGDVHRVTEEVWSHIYRYKVKTGVRIVEASIRKHIPSHIKIEGHRALITYEGQPTTCFRCNEQGHNINECPRQNNKGPLQSKTDENTWAQIVKNTNGKIGTDKQRNIPYAMESHEERNSTTDLEQFNSNNEPPKELPMTMNMGDPTRTKIIAGPSQPLADKTIDHKPSGMVGAEQTVTRDEERTPITAPKWPDLLTTDSESEYNIEQQRKRRERIKTPSKETTTHRDSPDTQTEADSLHRPTMQSPQRTKKIKVERDPP